jgi:glycosyltransferase involved in cell wall biosynthesis
VFYLGSEIERKNLKNSLAAFAIVKKKYPDLLFIKAPKEGMKGRREETLHYVRASGLVIDKDIIFINEYLPVETIVELYSNAELFLFPSLKEGFGFPIIEAQSCGCPVITTHYNPMQELVSYKEMTVNPTNPRDIAEKMMKVLENKNLREKMVMEGLQYSQKFSWEQTVKGFDEMISNL